jgi:hypothetical protein
MGKNKKSTLHGNDDIIIFGGKILRVSDEGVHEIKITPNIEKIKSNQKRNED